MERKRDMKKRIISLILVVIMLCSLLAGCGGNGGGSKASNKLTVGINQNSNITSFDDNAFTKYLEEIEGETLINTKETNTYIKEILCYHRILHTEDV